MGLAALCARSWKKERARWCLRPFLPEVAAPLSSQVEPLPEKAACVCAHLSQLQPTCFKLRCILEICEGREVI